MIFTFLLKKSGDGWIAEQVDTHDVFPLPADPKPWVFWRDADTNGAA
jgi:hypothetical protein